LGYPVVVGKPRNHTGSGQRSVDEQPHQVGIISNSTANRYGGGFGNDKDKLIVNAKEKITLQKFTSQIARSISKQRGVFIAVTYNLNYKIDSYKVLPYNNCRLGKKDDDKYNGKIGVSDKWEEKRLKEDDITFVDVFNPDEAIVKSQVSALRGSTEAEKLKNYKGQILYFNLDDEYIYALSQIDAVLKDCDSEAQASVYKNRSLRKGFFGKTIVITKPLAGSLTDYPDIADYNEALSERDNFKETIDSFIGADDNGGVIHVELEHDSENFEQEIMFKNIDSNIDDKIFEYTESSTFNNILMAFNSIPSGLIRPVNSLFGQSADAIEQMKLVYQDNTSTERREIQQLIQYLMSIFVNPVEGLEIEPLIKETKTDDTTDKQE
jgi:hypothetical protein